MEERKIMLVDDDQTLEFYVVEETKLNGANYLLVTDAEDDDEEGDCYILKDMSGADESDALYEFVEDEDELEGLIFNLLVITGVISLPCHVSVLKISESYHVQSLFFIQDTS